MLEYSRVILCIYLVGAEDEGFVEVYFSGGGSCAGCNNGNSPNPTALTLALNAPNQYPTSSESQTAYLTITNTSGVNATDLVYSVPLSTNYTFNVKPEIKVYQFSSIFCSINSRRAGVIFLTRTPVFCSVIKGVFNAYHPFNFNPKKPLNV